MKKFYSMAAIVAVLIFSAYSLLLPAGTDFQTLDKISVTDDGVVMELSGPVKSHVFRMSKPPKLVVEFADTEHNIKNKEIVVNNALINKIRSSQFKNEPAKVARVVIDLKKRADYELKSEGNIVTLLLKSVPAKPSTKKAAGTAAAAGKAKTTPKPIVTPSVPEVLPLPAAAPAPVVSAPVKPPAVTPAPAKLAAAPVEIPKPSITVKPVVPAPSAPAEKTPAVQSPVKETPVLKESLNKQPEAKNKPIVQAKAPAAVKKEPAPVEVIAEPVKPEPAAPVIKKKHKKNPVLQKTLSSDPAETKAVQETQARPSGLPRTLVTLDFESADIRDVMRVMSMKSGYNIIFGEDVGGTITLHLENVPFNRAFETILSLGSLVMQEEGPNIIRVATPKKISEERAQAVAFTKIFSLNYAKADDVKSDLDSVRNAEGRKGNISVDARTNSLVVTDTPNGLMSLEKLIAQLDKKPQQVLIEAKIVEVTLNNSSDIGIQWQYGGTSQNGNSSLTIGQKDSNGNVLSANQGGTGVQFPAAAVGGQSAAISFGLVANNFSLSGALNALEQKGISKILSTPKVTTLNNKEASILVGQKIPYTTTTISQGLSTQNTQFLDVGVKLNVTPTINADKRITLYVHPVVSLFVRADAAGPVIGTREAETTVMIQNEETIVIGGLITEDDKKNVTQVPLLGDLPVIGQFFKDNSKSKERTELLVFITPKILE